MADSVHHRAGLQHLALRQQEASATPAALVHQQHQQALVAVQGLERERVTPQQLSQGLEANQHQYNLHNQCYNLKRK
jgi:hypothetical protein